MMPGADGFELLEALRGVVPGVPVIMLTARSAVEDRIRGLELGAVDYVAKPFSFRELTARIRAQIRRDIEPPAGGAAASATPASICTSVSSSRRWECSRSPTASSRCSPT